MLKFTHIVIVLGDPGVRMGETIASQTLFALLECKDEVVEPGAPPGAAVKVPVAKVQPDSPSSNPKASCPLAPCASAVRLSERGAGADWSDIDATVSGID
jgi:hypothetical protein